MNGESNVKDTPVSGVEGMAVMAVALNRAKARVRNLIVWCNALCGAGLRIRW